jgi:hypothetical protein
MATTATPARVEVEVAPHVGVGLSTAAGGAVTVAAYLAAIVAFAQGARDEATLSALAVGTVALVTTIAGRVAQAVAAIKTATPAAAPLEARAALGVEARAYSAAEDAARNRAALASRLDHIIARLEQPEEHSEQPERPAPLPADAGIGEPAAVAADLEPAGPDDPGDLPLKPDVDLDDVADQADAVQPGSREADLGGDLCHPGDTPAAPARVRAEQTDDDR